MPQPPADQPDALDALQTRLQYRFADQALLARALIHRSYLNEAADGSLESNERLEFLGDAILGAVVARRLFEAFPDADEGRMSIARAQLVRKETLGRLGRGIGLGACLLTGAGADSRAARNRDSVLSCAVEAVIGAVWLDGGDAAARRVILRLLEPEWSSVGEAGVAADAKSRLQHLTQSRNGAKPRYDTIGVEGPPHRPSFRAVVEIDGERIAEGEGRSKQAAEMDAACRALSLLQDEREAD